MSIRSLVLAALAAWPCLTVRADAAPANVLRVAGETSPLGWLYSSFSEGTVDGSGRLVFVGGSSGVFVREAGTITQRIGAGVVLPDGRRVAGVGAPALAAGGCALTRATFVTGGDAIVEVCGTTVSVLLDAGMTAPGGGTIRAFDTTVAGAGAETVAAAATLQDGTSVLLRRDAGGVVEVARSGGAAPTGGTFAAFRLLGVTSAGQVGFRATVSGGPDGLFAATATSVDAVALVGQGTPAGGSYTAISGGSVHPSGQWAFHASLSTDQAGVFAVDFSGPLPLVRPVVLSGAALPIDGATIRGFPESMEPSVNGAGTVAFRALIASSVESAPPSGVFTAAIDGTIARIATVRQEFPGLGTISRLRDPAIADDGSVLVSAFFAGAASGLFVARNGGLASLARFGDGTAVDNGDARFRFGPGGVKESAEGAVFLGERDGIFRSESDGTVAPLVYGGRPGPLGGVIALFGSPAVDGRGTVFFGAEFQGAQFNEALLGTTGGSTDPVVTPDRRLLGGGGIRELFPTNVDTLARPAAGPGPGVVFTAALRGAKATEAVFLAKRATNVRALARAGQHAGGSRLASFGTPSLGRGTAMAVLAQIGREQRRDAVVARTGGRLAVVAFEGAPTRTRLNGKFGELGPPAIGLRGTVFRSALTTQAQEGIFVGRGGRLAVVAATGDLTTTGGRLRTFDDPRAVADQVWFLARIAGSEAPAGLYRVMVPKAPHKSDAPFVVESVLLPGDPAPAPLGGVIVRLDALRVGPSGVVTVVAGIGGGTTAGAILQVAP
jgi:hypothetical protein